jgi:hypothetical protein
LRDTDRNLARRSRGTKTGLVAAICIVVSLAGVGTLFLIDQISKLKNELSGVRRELVGARDRIARLEGKVEETVSLRRNDLDRQRAPLELSREEMQLVKDYIKVPPAPPGTSPAIQIGTVVSPGLLVPLPPQIGEKYPRLIGSRYMTDRNGAIVIVTRGSRHADAIVGPN